MDKRHLKKSAEEVRRIQELRRSSAAGKQHKNETRGSAKRRAIEESD